jgi:uncharacterized protein with FMN-binding domain
MKFLYGGARIGALVFGLAWVLLLSSCFGGRYVAGSGGPENPARTGYRDGTWEGGGQGYGGDIWVQVRVASAIIQGIEISAHNEDPFIGGAAMDELLELVLEYQSTDLDGISGATESGTGFLAAVEDALNRARLNQAAE